MTRRRITLQSRILEQLERQPDRPAMGFMASDGAIAWRSRSEFHQAAVRTAQGLRALGLRGGDVCIIVLPAREFAAEAVLATLLLGAIPLLVAPPLIQGVNSNLLSVLERTARRTRARLVICDSSLRVLERQLREARPRTRFVFGEEAVRSQGGDEPAAAVAPEPSEIAALQLTSGTTGFPRVCVWKHDGVLAALEAMAPAMKLGAEDTCFNWTPLYHDMGLVNNFLLCLVTGTPLVSLSPHDFVKRPALWLRGLASAGATHTWSPNFGFALAASRISDEELEGVRLDGVRAFWNAAERIHLETITAFHRRFEPFGVRLSALKTNFGCAENVGGATFSNPDGTFVYERIDRAALYDRRIALTVDDRANGSAAVSVVGAGRAAPGIEIRILSRTGEALPEGHVGEIGLRTPSRMVGYLRDARATRRAIHGDLLRTGDLGYLRGGELFWVGRARERITIAGKKLDPSDFERILLGVPGLRPGCFAAFGVDDPARGTQRVVIVSEVQENGAVHVQTLTTEIRKRVSIDLGIEAGDVVLVPKGTLTKTSSGKRRHRHFRQLYTTGELTRSRLHREHGGPTSAVAPEA